MVAIFALGIWAISLISYQVFWWGYVKQIFAVAGLVAVVGLRQRGRGWWWILLAIVLGIHRPTAVFASLVFGLWGLWARGNFGRKTVEKFWVKFVGAVGLWFLSYLPVRDGMVAGLRKSVATIGVAGGETGGTFFSTVEYGAWNGIVLLLAVVGIAGLDRGRGNSAKNFGEKWKNFWKKFGENFLGEIRGLWFLVGAVWVGTDFYFASRVLGIWDVAVVVRAARGGAMLWNFGQENLRNIEKNLWRKFVGGGRGIVVALAVGQLILWGRYSRATDFGLVTEEEFVGIQEISSVVSETGLVVVLEPRYASFVMGYGLRQASFFDFRRDEWWTRDDRKEIWLWTRQPARGGADEIFLQENRVEILAGICEKMAMLPENSRLWEGTIQRKLPPLRCLEPVLTGETRALSRVVTNFGEESFGEF